MAYFKRVTRMVCELPSDKALRRKNHCCTEDLRGSGQCRESHEVTTAAVQAEVCEQEKSRQ